MKCFERSTPGSQTTAKKPVTSKSATTALLQPFFQQETFIYQQIFFQIKESLFTVSRTGADGW